MDKEIKKTKLYEWHKKNNANMAEFGGYEMPLWYSSAKNEHLIVLTNVGIFDTSHMASVIVSGADSFDLLQHCFTSNLSQCIGSKKEKIFPGRAVYGVFLNNKGEVIDDAIVFMITQEKFIVVVNAGMGKTITDHLNKNNNDRDANIRDLTDNLGKMDIQGPQSAEVMAKILADPEKVFHNMPYFSFKGFFEPDAKDAGEVILKNDIPIILSRTGYTGEFGFEIFTPPGCFVDVWELVLKAGEEFNIMTCGLAARDSLRTGAVLPLSHQDIGHWPFINTPWNFALPYTDDGKKFTKDFIGSNALLNMKNPEYTYPFAGNDLRKVTLPAAVLDKDEKEIGTVLTCATDMAIGLCENKIYSIASPDKPENFKAKGLSCGFVKVTKAISLGEKLILKDSRRKIEVRIVNDIRPHRSARNIMKK